MTSPVRLVVVGSALTDLRGQVVRGPHTGPGQLHGAAAQHTHTHSVLTRETVRSVALCSVLQALCLPVCVFTCPGGQFEE